MTTQLRKYTPCQTFYMRLIIFQSRLMNKCHSQEKIKAESNGIAKLLTDHLTEEWVLEAYEEFYNKLLLD